VKQLVIFISLFILLASSFIGCESTPPSHASRLTPTPTKELRAQKDLRSAWELYEDDAYHQVIPNVEHILRRYPSTRASIESNYLLALAYFKIEGYPDSVAYLVEYLNQVPEGKFSVESRELIKRIAIAYERQYPSEERVEKHLKSVEALLETNPTYDLQLQEADLNWQLKHYAKAGDLYIKLLDKNSELAKDVLFNRRIQMHDDSTYTVLTPEILSKRNISNNPIIVRNTHSFRLGGGYRYQHPKKFYVVTGEVTNRSDSTVGGIELFTTIYGFGHIIYDTTQYKIGRLKPGESRSFSFRFQNFDNIDAVSYHESKVRYQR